MVSGRHYSLVFLVCGNAGFCSPYSRLASKGKNRRKLRVWALRILDPNGQCSLPRPYNHFCDSLLLRVFTFVL